MPRGWVYEPTISPYDALLFYNAMKRHYDPFCYTPVAVAKREEIGTKYRYLCIAHYRNALEQDSLFARIEIYKPIAGMPYATCLHRLSQDAWS
ncbi:MAG: hypothetical protein K0R34_55 [Herbinix sp.]|jgi:hypothetical protein|nr:hypothetical protein [Herbinix sp.]